MKANRVLYNIKSINTGANKENSQVLCMNFLQLFCDTFGIIVCNLVINQSNQERLFTVTVLKAFLFSLLIFCLHNTQFPITLLP